MSTERFKQELRATRSVAFDAVADVVVVGTGAGGFAAAVTAARSGAKVVMLEKAGTIGGTTKKAAAAYWVPNNHFMRERGVADPKSDALRHMARLSRPARYNPQSPTLGLMSWEYELTESFYDHAGEAVEQLTQWGALEPVPWDVQPDYYAEMAENKAPHGRILYPHRFKGVPGEIGDGADMIACFDEAARKLGVQIHTGHAVSQLIVSEAGTVDGVVAKGAYGELCIRAKNVVFASGGFTHNVALRESSLPGPVFGGCAAKSNTGDFIPLALAMNADLVNMNGAWLAPMVLDRAIANQPDATCSFSIPGDSMLFVNRYGKRVVNEKSPYQDLVQAFWTWESQHAEYPNLFMIMVWDEAAKAHCSGTRYGNPMVPDGGDQRHIISAPTFDALTDAIRTRLEVYGEHTGGWMLDASFTENLKASVERFNGFARTGVDQDFHRGEAAIERYFNMGGRPGNSLNETMWPFLPTGPYHATILAPATLDTKGGPRTDPHGRVLTRHGTPIPGLFAVGNCAGAMSAGSYWAGGATLGPILTSGYLAGLAAAASRSITPSLTAHP